MGPKLGFAADAEGAEFGQAQEGPFSGV